MRKDTFDLARKITNKISDISSEIQIWEEKFTKVSDIAYQADWDSKYGRLLKSNIDDEVFVVFRRNCINNLKLKRIALENELEAL